MNSSLQLLAKLKELSPAVLEPQLSVPSRYGYEWPLAREIFSGEPGAARELLEDLADGDYLERQFRDKVLLCPFSREVHVAFREICPQCRSANLERQQMIHHFRCGHVGPERAFQRAGRFVCPKCDHQLKHIGVDYERPSEVFVCNDCDWTGSTPLAEGHCLGCGRLFDAEQALEQVISAYVLTARGALAVQEGSLAGGGEGGILDLQYGTLTPEVIGLMYRNLHEQAQRYHRPLSVVCAHFDQYHHVSATYGLGLASTVMKRVIGVLRELLRTCDLVAVIDDHAVLVILPETPLTGARVLSDRVQAAFRQLEFEDLDRPATLSLGVAALVGTDHEETTDPADRNLVELAEQLAEEASRAGGDRVLVMGVDAAEEAP